MKKLILFLICASMMTSCGNSQVKVEYFERPVKTITVESVTDISRTFSGIVKAKNESDIGFKMGGEIVHMAVEDGEKIKKGDLIAEVDNHDYQLKYDAQFATYKNAQSQIARYKKLYAKHAISQQDYEMAQTNYAQSKAAYKSAKDMLKDTKLYAPFTGIIEKRYVNQYQRVQPSEPVVRLINPNELEVDFTLPIKNLYMLNYKSKSFSVVIDNYPNISFSAKIDKYVDSSPDGSGIPVTLVLDDPEFSYEKYNIKSGFSCDVTVNIWADEPSSDIVIPLSAVHYDKKAKREIVWKYDAQTKTVKSQNVILGDLQGVDNIIITSGLKSGDVIVSAGVHQVIDGQKVKVVK